jgi:hypothetical protein
MRRNTASRYYAGARRCAGGQCCGTAPGFGPQSRGAINGSPRIRFSGERCNVEICSPNLPSRDPNRKKAAKHWAKAAQQVLVGPLARWHPRPRKPQVVGHTVVPSTPTWDPCQVVSLASPTFCMDPPMAAVAARRASTPHRHTLSCPFDCCLLVKFAANHVVCPGTVPQHLLRMPWKAAAPVLPPWTQPYEVRWCTMRPMARAVVCANGLPSKDVSWHGSRGMR